MLDKPKAVSNEMSPVGCLIMLIISIPFLIMGVGCVREWNKIVAKNNAEFERQKAAANSIPLDPTLAACELTPTRIEIMGSHAVADSLRWQLKAPSTATFSGMESSFTVGKDCTIDMDGWVDAQNSFGAMVRTPWTARLRGRGSDFRVIDARLLN